LYGALSLTRGTVCRLLLLLAFASAVIFGSESHGTCDHILLLEFKVEVKVKVKVKLRLTVGQSVSLGVERHLGLMTRYLLLIDNYGLVFVGRLL
jgi:hypothetical protein